MGSTKWLLMVELREVSPRVGAPAGPLIDTSAASQGWSMHPLSLYSLFGGKLGQVLGVIWGEFCTGLGRVEGR